MAAQPFTPPNNASAQAQPPAQPTQNGLSPKHPSMLAANESLRRALGSRKVQRALLFMLDESMSLRITLKMPRGAQGGVGVQISLEDRT
jgi:hypothetical protein